MRLLLTFAVAVPVVPPVLAQVYAPPAAGLTPYGSGRTVIPARGWVTRGGGGA